MISLQISHIATMHAIRNVTGTGFPIVVAAYSNSSSIIAPTTTKSHIEAFLKIPLMLL